jgi:mutator protein MutT
MKIDQEFIDDVYPFAPQEYTRYSSRGVVINKNNQVAILHIVGKDNFGKRNHYELPGGGIEIGETPLHCFQREMKEELGVITKDETMIGVIRYTYHLLKRYDVSYLYVAYVDTFCKPTYTPDEQALIQQVIWLDIDELIKHLDGTNVENVGKLIHRRDHWILLRAKAYLTMNHTNCKE